RRPRSPSDEVRAGAGSLPAPALLRWNDLNETAWLARWWLRPEGMGGRGILGLSPAQRDGAALFVQSGSSQRSRQGGGRSQAPRGPAAIPTRSKVAYKPKGEPSRKIPASVSPR